MKKWIWISIGGLVVLVIVAIVIGLSNLGPIIKKAVNSYGPRITKTELHVGDVDVGLFSAKAKIQDFFLGNPEGFKAPEAIRVGSIFVSLDKGSLTKDTIVLKRVEIISPLVTYEKSGRGDNFQTILKNVKDSATKETSSAKGEPPVESSGKKLIIEDLVITGGKVRLFTDIPGLGTRSVTASIPEIHLKDIGKDKGGETPAQAIKKILEAMYAKLKTPEVLGTIREQLKALDPRVQEKLKELETKGKELEKGLSEKGTEKIDELKEKAKDFFGR